MTSGVQASWRGSTDGYGVAYPQGGNAIANSYDYMGAWGYERVGRTSTSQGYLLAGVRVYDPETGTFLQQDPLSIGIGDYIYANGDPVNMVDPSGMQAVDTPSSPHTRVGAKTLPWIVREIGRLGNPVVPPGYMSPRGIREGDIPRPPGAPHDWRSKWRKIGNREWYDPRTGDRWHFHEEDDDHYSHWDQRPKRGGHFRHPVKPGPVFKPKKSLLDWILGR